MAAKKPTGRPTLCTDEVADYIIEQMSCGRSLRSICLEDNMPKISTVLRWLQDDRHQSFLDRYTRAYALRADAIFEDMMHIADTPLLGEETEIDAEGGVKTKRADAIRHRNLQIETRKWILGRMAPSKYGDKQTVEVGNKDDKAFKTDDGGKSATDIAKAVAEQLRAKRAKEEGDKS